MALTEHSRMSCFTACVIAWSSVFLAAGAATSNNTAMWPDYARDSQKNINAGITLQTAIPLTYFETITDVLFLSINGYVSFGAEYSGAVPPPSKWPFAPKTLAVYWTDNNTIPMYPSPLPTLYTLLDESRLQNVGMESSLIQYIKKVVNQPDFEPLVAFAVTWEDVRTPVPNQFPNDTATFQLLIATDSQVTYAVRSYQKVWQSPELSKLTYYAGTYSLGNGARPKISTPGSQTQPDVIRLGNKAPNKDPYNCVQKAIASIISLNSSIYAVPPCPCYRKQAAIDVQFTMSSTYPNCYQSVNPPSGGSLLQLCCYNQYGILVNLTKEAMVPVSVNPSDLSLQAAYNACCADGSGLCRWFLLNIYRPTCVTNTTMLNVAQLPSFTNTVSDFTYTASPSKPMTYVYNFTNSSSTPVSYNASGVFTSSHGFSLDRTGFSWNIGKGFLELRKLPYPQQLTFYMTDSNNLTVAYAPLFKLCLCEQTDQCNANSFPVRFDANQEAAGFIGLDRYEKGNVNMMLCTCKGTSTGRFCEKPINACDDCLIQQTSTCAGLPQDYCPTCPSGYTTDGSQCRDSSTGGGNSNYNITTAHMFLLVIFSFISTSFPYLPDYVTTLL